MPFAWNQQDSLRLVDALFTATSAVCVTGLTTVNTADFSFWGQLILLILIQAGGLGIISFTTIYIILPRKRISLKNLEIIKSFSLDSVENKPQRIIRQIILFTLCVETLGFVILYFFFRPLVGDKALFTSIFHSISAFCNAGFSLFRNNLEGYTAHTGISLTVAVLVILGGMGFIVYQDIGKKLTGARKNISYHSRLVILITVIMIVSATVIFFVLEFRNSLTQYPVGIKWLASFFQAVTPRTAGFNTIPQQSLSFPSKLITLPLMFIGGSSGSIAGGIKITTVFLVIMLIIKERDVHDEICVLKRKIPSAVLSNASIFTIRAFLILFTCIFLLTITEHLGHSSHEPSFISLIFESFSAFGTVGLSLGITPSLSRLGRLIIIFTMFSGRVGLISIAMGRAEKISALRVDYPRGEVLIG